MFTHTKLKSGGTWHRAADLGCTHTKVHYVPINVIYCRVYSFAFTVLSPTDDVLFSKLSIICCKLSVVVVGKVARPSSATNKQETSSIFNHKRTEVCECVPFRDDVFRSQLGVRGEAVSTGPLPACLCGPAPRNFKQPPGGIRIVLTREKSYYRSNVIRL